MTRGSLLFVIPTCKQHFTPHWQQKSHLFLNLYLFLTSKYYFRVCLTSSQGSPPWTVLCVFVLCSPSSRSAWCRPSPITSAAPWDYSTNVCLRLSVLRGKITSALHPPREVNQSVCADAGINQSHPEREGGGLNWAQRGIRTLLSAEKCFEMSLVYFSLGCEFVILWLWTRFHYMENISSKKEIKTEKKETVLYQIWTMNLLWMIKFLHKWTHTLNTDDMTNVLWFQTTILQKYQMRCSCDFKLKNNQEQSDMA